MRDLSLIHIFHTGSVIWFSSSFHDARNRAKLSADFFDHGVCGFGDGFHGPRAVSYTHLKEGKVTSITGKELDIKGDTLCVHGDGPKALAFVKRVREAFEREGIEIKSI